MPARLVFSLPFAPIAALLVIALVVGMARLLFTGAIVLPASVTGDSSPPPRPWRRIRRRRRRGSAASAVANSTAGRA